MDRPKGYTARINENGYAETPVWPRGTRKYAVTIVGPSGTLSFPYHTGPAITEKPKLQDVVQAAITDGQFYEDNPTVERFSAEAGGYETGQDLMRAFKACQRMAEGTRRVFGDDYDAMAEWSADK